MGRANNQSMTDYFAYVGCRTSKERQGRGEGIDVFRIDGRSGAWSPINQVKGLENPSFLAFDRTGQLLFTVHGDMDTVSSFRIDRASGKLTFVNRVACGGRNPVHLVTDPTNRFLITANYASGTLGAVPFAADGTLGALADVATLAGELGPHKTQQIGLYPHHIPYAPGDRWLVIPDKGGDQVCVYGFDAAIGKFRANDPVAVKTRSGSGPRHIDFHPSLPLAYLANELDSTIATYAWDGAKGMLRPLQILPSLPDDYFGNNTTAEIWVAPSGRHVYISNRGHDSIVIFAIDPTRGLLSAVGWQSTLGRQPRFFRFDPAGRFLFACNELSDTIVTFTVDAASGRLEATGNVAKSGTPTCIILAAC